MANGYCPPLLMHIAAMSGCDPSHKIADLGFLSAALKTQDDSVIISQGNEGGHTRPLTVWYRERLGAAADGMPDCTTGVTSPRKEFSLPSLVTKSKSVWLSRDLIRNYCRDASEQVNLTGANPGTRTMREVYDLILAAARSVLTSVDTALVTSMSTQFGENVTTGLTTAKALEFDPAAPAAAFMSLLSDLRENEFCDFSQVSFVGTGPFINTELFRNWWKCCNQQGMDMGAMTASFNSLFFDKNARTVWGTDHVGVFDKGSIAVVNAPKYVADFAGTFGGSEFFTLNMPASEICCPQQYLDRLTLDVQIKEYDCNPTLALDGGAAAAAGGPGVMIMLSWTGALFVRPDMFAATDPMDGTNGTLRYVISEPVVTP